MKKKRLRNKLKINKVFLVISLIGLLITVIIFNKFLQIKVSYKSNALESSYTCTIDGFDYKETVRSFCNNFSSAQGKEYVCYPAQNPFSVNCNNVRNNTGGNVCTKCSGGCQSGKCARIAVSSPTPIPFSINSITSKVSVIDKNRLFTQVSLAITANNNKTYNASLVMFASYGESKPKISCSKDYSELTLGKYRKEIPVLKNLFLIAQPDEAKDNIKFYSAYYDLRSARLTELREIFLFDTPGNLSNMLIQFNNLSYPGIPEDQFVGSGIYKDPIKNVACLIRG